jgi:glutamyl-tRNA synthetase
MAKKRWKENTPKILRNLVAELKTISNYTAENIETGIKSYLEKNELSMGQVMTAMRLALVGSGMGPGVMDIMALIGKKEVENRITKAINVIG